MGTKRGPKGSAPLDPSARQLFYALEAIATLRGTEGLGGAFLTAIALNYGASPAPEDTQAIDEKAKALAK